MKTGYIAEYKNPDDLANGVDLFLSDDNLREKAGILARKKIEDNFTPTRQVENYLKLYAQMLDKNR
jgi:glycosyltransferase involved in cell wall biosynthesis